MISKEDLHVFKLQQFSSDVTSVTTMIPVPQSCSECIEINAILRGTLVWYCLVRNPSIQILNSPHRSSPHPTLTYSSSHTTPPPPPANVGHASPEQLAQLREAIHKLPKPNFELLKYLIRHLIKVTEHSGECAVCRGDGGGV